MRYTTNTGDTDQGVVEELNGPASGAQIEAAFDINANLSRHEVLMGLSRIHRRILMGAYPPAATQTSGAGTPSFPNTYFVSTSDPLADFTSIADINSFGGFAAGDTVRFKYGDTFSSGLNPPVSGMIFDAYGDPADGKPILGAVEDLLNVAWVDNGGSIPWTYTYEYTSAALPARCLFEASWIDSSDRIGLMTEAPAKAGAQVDVSVDILGTAGVTWSQIRQNLWTRSVSITASRHLAWLAVDGGTPKQGKLFQGDCTEVGDFHVSGTSGAFCLYSPDGDPAEAFSSIRASCAWFASTVSGTTRRITIFSPNGPTTDFTRILVGGKGSSGSEALNLVDTSRHTFRNLQMLGTDTCFTSADNLPDCTFENVDFRMAQTRGGRVENGCHRWTFRGCRFSDNGDANSQSGNGIMSSNSTSDLVQDLNFIDCEMSFNGGDGYTPQAAIGSNANLVNCVLAHNGENPIDLKGNEEVRVISCLCISSILSAGAGTDALVNQFRSRLIARDSVFVGAIGRFDVTGTGKNGFTSAPETVQDIERCIFYGENGASEFRPGDDSHGGPPQYAAGGKFTAKASLFVGARQVMNGKTFGIAAQDVDLFHCTVAHKNAGTNADLISLTPGSGQIASFTVTNQAIRVRNSILYADGSSTSAYVFDRSVTSLDNVTVELLNNLYFQSAAPTNWMNGGDSNLYTAAQIDADIAQTGFTLTSELADPTADPMFDNPNEGGQRILTSDLRGIGNWGIGGTLYRLGCASISASPNAPLVGELVTGEDSGATGYIRDIWADGLLLSSVTGTFDDGENIIGQWGGTIAVAAVSSAQSAALTLKALAWDAQAANFSTLGQVLTGGTSGHTGYLVSQVDAGTSGIAVLAVTSSATFADNETVTGASQGSITVNGVLTQSPARRAAKTLWPRILRGAPTIDEVRNIADLGSSASGDDYENFAINFSGSDTLTVTSATKRWVRSGATTWASQGARAGLKFWANDINTTIDSGGPFTIASVDSATQITTVEDPGADSGGAITDASLTLAGQADMGCFPIT